MCRKVLNSLKQPKTHTPDPLRHDSLKTSHMWYMQRVYSLLVACCMVCFLIQVIIIIRSNYTHTHKTTVNITINTANPQNNMCLYAGINVCIKHKEVGFPSVRVLGSFFLVILLVHWGNLWDTILRKSPLEQYFLKTATQISRTELKKYPKMLGNLSKNLQPNSEKRWQSTEDHNCSSSVA